MPLPLSSVALAYLSLCVLTLDWISRRSATDEPAPIQVQDQTRAKLRSEGEACFSCFSNLIVI